MMKFRTMREVGHPVKKEDYIKKQDSRITKVGKFLRNSSIDELPQLFNILHGTMPLVGPRPQPVPQVDYYVEHIPNYDDRHHVKPGLTGLVQISDLRSEVKPEEQNRRLKLDIYYINHWSFWFDVYIMMRTILTLGARYHRGVTMYNDNVTKKKRRSKKLK